MLRKRKWLIILLLLFVVGCQNNESIKEKDYTYLKQIQDISKYDNTLTEDFLNYIYSNYGAKVISEVYDSFSTNSYDKNVWHSLTGKSFYVLEDSFNGGYDDVNNVKVMSSSGKNTISFVGDISLADDWEIIPYYDSRGEGVYGILSTDVVDIMRSSSIMVANNEFTISNRGSKLPNKYYTFRAKPERLAIYDEMGVDIVTIANNHAYDYGEDAFLDTLDSLKKYNIPYVGGGRDIDEAKSPYYFILNGYKIAFIGATRAEKYILTPEATDSTSGVFRAYDPTMLLETIKEVKKNSDYVILLIHWGKEDSHELENVQIETGKEYIDAGVDLLIGGHAHTLQGMEFYNDKLIAYNLGDFIFNRESKDTGVLSVTIENDGNMKYKFIPCRQDNFKTTLLSGNDSIRVINDMRSYSINTIFEDNGEFRAKS